MWKGPCTLRHGIQKSMEAILACHPALSTKWLVWVATSCELSHTVEPVLATTWQKRPPENCGHAISVPSIRGFKCTECILENVTTWEMRIADTGGRPKVSIQPAKSDHIRQNWVKNTFWLSNFSFAGTPNERSSRLQARLGMVVANYALVYTWELPIADVDGSRTGMCTTPYRKFLNQTWQMRPPEKQDHLFPVPSVVVIHRFDCMCTESIESKPSNLFGSMETEILIWFDLFYLKKGVSLIHTCTR